MIGNRVKLYIERINLGLAEAGKTLLGKTWNYIRLLCENVEKKKKKALMAYHW